MKKILGKLFKNHIFELLSYPPYLYFTISVFFSQVAFNMLNIVLIFLIFHLTSSNFSVAILLFALLIPQIVLSFIGGVLADLGDKKKILVVGNFLRALVILILFFNSKLPFLVYLVTLLVSIVTQFYVPAESPLIPKLVRRDRLVAANSIFGISLFGSILIGYVLAGPFVSAFGRSNVFLILSIVFVIAGFFALLIPQKGIVSIDIPSAPKVERSIILEFKNSFSLLAKTRKVADAFFLLIFSQIIIFILASIIPGYAESLLQIPAESLSFILFAPAAVGMVIAAIGIGGIFHKAPKGKVVNAGVFISGFVLMLFPFTSKILAKGFIVTLNAFLPHYLNLNIFNFVVVLAFFAGFANALIFVPSQAIIQESIPEDFRSKIYGLLFAFIGVFSLVPIMVAGGIADLIGVGAVFFSIGAIVVCIGILRIRFFLNDKKPRKN